METGAPGRTAQVLTPGQKAGSIFSGTLSSSLQKAGRLSAPGSHLLIHVFKEKTNLKAETNTRTALVSLSYHFTMEYYIVNKNHAYSLRRWQNVYSIMLNEKSRT